MMTFRSNGTFAVAVTLGFVACSKLCKPDPNPDPHPVPDAGPIPDAGPRRACRPPSDTDFFGNTLPTQNPQGPLLEGNGLELIHFQYDGGTLEGAQLPIKGYFGEDGGQAFAKVTGCTTAGLRTRCNLEASNGYKHCGQPAVMVNGYWDCAGHFQDEPGTVTFSCQDGAINKCIYGFKYEPEDRDRFLACIRMARADYCGTGFPATAEGTLVDAYDPAPTASNPAPRRNPPTCGKGMCHEADWGTEGATCISHWRTRRPNLNAPGQAPGNQKAQTDPSACNFVDAGNGLRCRSAAGRAVLANRSAELYDQSSGTPSCRAGAWDPDCADAGTPTGH